MAQDDASDEFRDWVRGRISLAKRLDGGECGGSYGDAMLILSALLSGRAADLWPGKRKDRHRSVEAWSVFSDPGLTPNWVSIPGLWAARGTAFRKLPVPNAYVTTYLLGSGRSRTGPLNRGKGNDPYSQGLHGGSAGSERIHGR